MNDKRMSRDEAKAYHPSNYFHRQMEAIWTPADFEQTVLDAQAVVEAGKRRPGLVGEDERGRPVPMFALSRERRARRMDAFAVALLLALMAAFGALLMIASAPEAKAAPGELNVSDEVLDYAASRGQIACGVLDEYPTVNGLIGLMQGIVNDGGFSMFEAGQVTALAVFSFCPEHVPVLERFVALYGDEEPRRGQVA